MDIKLLQQLAAHLYSMECVGDELEEAKFFLLKEAIRNFASKSHRASECGIEMEDV